MRVLLVNPPAKTIFARLGMSLPPLGLLYIASVLEAQGHQLAVQDFAVDGRVEKFDFSPWDAVGITTDTCRAEQAYGIARRAKDAGALVVMGGPHTHYCEEEALAPGHVDYVVHGEGEETMAELLAAVGSGADPRQVPGLSWAEKTLSNGEVEIRRSGRRAPVDDLSALPFPSRHLLRLHAYDKARVWGRSTATISTSRGCPSNCHFCSVPDFVGRRLRFRTLENVMREIDEIYHRHGYRALAFMDDNFTVNPQWASGIAEAIIERGYDLNLWLFSRPDTIVRNPEMVRLLARAGTKTIFMGIESGREETLEAFNKRCAPDVAREAVALLKQEGIETLGAFILGALEDDREAVRQLVDYARELDTETAQFSILTPFPGTRLYQQLQPRIKVRGWSEYDGSHLVFDHPSFPGRSMERWLIWANIRFYFRSRESIGRFFTFLRNRRRSGREPLHQI
jgi:anaerobic magnesium-protoporphyrin IX monomethyl ester cyclase